MAHTPATFPAHPSARHVACSHYIRHTHRHAPRHAQPLHRLARHGACSHYTRHTHSHAPRHAPTSKNRSRGNSVTSPISPGMRGRTEAIAFPLWLSPQSPGRAPVSNSQEAPSQHQWPKRRTPIGRTPTSDVSHSWRHRSVPTRQIRQDIGGGVTHGSGKRLHGVENTLNFADSHGRHIVIGACTLLCADEIPI